MSNNNALYEPQTYEILSTNLSNLDPKPKKLTMINLIQKLRPQIKDAISKGYTYKEISELFNQKGVKVSISTLKNYSAKSKLLSKKQ